MSLTRRTLASLFAAAAFAGASHADAQSRRAADPKPQAKDSGAGPTQIVEFLASPFPYEGRVPGTDKPFLDAMKDGRRGHIGLRDTFYAESPTYADRRVLLHLSPGFNASRPAALVVFLHGSKATLVRDVRNRQKVTQQFDAAGINGALIAPQLAVDALDASAGRFWEPGFFTTFLDEAASRLGEMSKTSGSIFRAMLIVVVAYDSGAHPAAFALQIGGAASRIHGVVLLNALPGEQERYVNWLATKRNDAFFFSAYSASLRADNTAMKKALVARGLAPRDARPTVLTPGSLTFLDAGNADPNDFVSKAWVAEPLKVVLSQIPEFKRQLR